MSRKTVVDNRRGMYMAQKLRGWRPAMLLVLVVALLVAGALLSWLARGESQPVGRILAHTTRYDAGKASMRDGLITATFPLTVEGDILIARLEST
jgi:hypothetical protein